MSSFEKKLLSATALLAVYFGSVDTASAMHIMEGFLPLKHAIFWGVICIPFLVLGYVKILKIVKRDRRNGLIIAMAGAFAFVLSALKIPSVTGSSSHPSGTGFGAILLSPAPMSILGAIVLLFQALFLAHGGLTTLGANIFSMAIVGPFAVFGVYKLLMVLKVNKKIAIFFAAMLGNLLTYCVTSVQLGFAHPSAIGGAWVSTMEFLGVFALTQIPLSIIEGLLTVVVFIGLETYAVPELRSLGFLKGAHDEAE